MEGNLPKDNLESFFRKGINDQPNEPRTDGWDTPDDLVWKGISGGLPITPVSKGKTLFFKWLSVFGIVIFLGGIGYLWKYMEGAISLVETPITESEEVEHLEKNKTTKETRLNPNEQSEDVNTGENELKNTDSQLIIYDDKKVKILDETSSDLLNNEEVINKKTIKAKKKPSIKSKKNQLIATAKEVEEIEKLKRESTTFNEQKKEDDFNNIAESANQNKRNTIIEIPAKEETSVATDSTNKERLMRGEIEKVVKNAIAEASKPATESASTLSEKENQQSTLIGLARKPIKSIENLLPYSIEGLVPIIDNQVEPAHFEKRFYLGAIALSTASSRVIKHQAIDRQRFERIREQEREIGQLTFGVIGGWQFHKNWSIESGIYQGKSTIESLHRIELTYRKDRERPSSTTDALESDYEVSLRSSYGDVNTNISIARNPRISINDRQQILLLLQTEQDLNYVDIPLLLKYHGRKGALNFTLKAGIAGRLVGDSKVEAVKGEIFPKINGLGARLPRQRILNALDKRPDSSINYMLGLGLSYRIWNNLHITLEPTFSRSFQPVFEKGGVATYAQSLNWQVGVKYYIL